MVKAMNRSALDSGGGSATESLYHLGKHLTLLCIPVSCYIFFMYLFLGNENWNIYGPVCFIRLAISNCNKAHGCLKASVGLLNPFKCSGWVGGIWELASILKYRRVEAGASLQLVLPCRERWKCDVLNCIQSPAQGLDWGLDSWSAQRPASSTEVKSSLLSGQQWTLFAWTCLAV